MGNTGTPIMGVFFYYMPKGVYPRTKYTKKPITKRFYSKTKWVNDCLEWTGSLNEAGYGRFQINYKAVLAHRVSWQLNHGVIPDEAFVLHKCDNPKCVNPNHLYLGTQMNNMQDRLKRNRNPKKMPHLNRGLVTQIKELLVSGNTLRDISTSFKVSIGTISSIKTGRTWNGL